jgi:hypothetical protein
MIAAISFAYLLAAVLAIPRARKDDGLGVASAPYGSIRKEATPLQGSDHLELAVDANGRFIDHEEAFSGFFFEGRRATKPIHIFSDASGSDSRGNVRKEYVPNDTKASGVPIALVDLGGRLETSYMGIIVIVILLVVAILVVFHMRSAGSQAVVIVETLRWNADVRDGASVADRCDRTVVAFGDRRGCENVQDGQRDVIEPSLVKKVAQEASPSIAGLMVSKGPNSNEVEKPPPAAGDTDMHNAGLRPPIASVNVVHGLHACSQQHSNTSESLALEQLSAIRIQSIQRGRACREELRSSGVGKSATAPATALAVQPKKGTVWHALTKHNISQLPEEEDEEEEPEEDEDDEATNVRVGHAVTNEVDNDDKEAHDDEADESEDAESDEEDDLESKGSSASAAAPAAAPAAGAGTTLCPEQACASKNIQRTHHAPVKRKKKGVVKVLAPCKTEELVPQVPDSEVHFGSSLLAWQRH